MPGTQQALCKLLLDITIIIINIHYKLNHVPGSKFSTLHTLLVFIFSPFYVKVLLFSLHFIDEETETQILKELAQSHTVSTTGPQIILFHSVLFCYNVNEKKENQFQAMVTVCVEFAHSPHVGVGFLRVLQFTPTSHSCACEGDWRV